MPKPTELNLRRLVAGVLAAACTVASAAAQTFPSRPITLVVAYAAGGPSDAIARIIGERMGRSLGQTFVIENTTGGGGTLAGDRVANAPPDGYMILIQHLALLAQNKMYPNVRYDARTALVPLGLVNSGPLILVTRNAIPAKSPAELLTWLNSNGEKVTVGHAGLGSNTHLCAVQLAQALGTKFTYVTYRGSAPALNDLAAGHIDLMCDQTTSSVPLALAGNITPIAVTTPERSPAIPNTPTTAEIGIAEVNYTVWHGLYAPKDTPNEIVARINAALDEAVGDPEVQAKFAQAGTVAFPKDQRSPVAHAKLFAIDYDRINKLIDAAGVTPQ